MESAKKKEIEMEYKQEKEKMQRVTVKKERERIERQNKEEQAKVEKAKQKRAQIQREIIAQKAHIEHIVTMCYQKMREREKQEQKAKREREIQRAKKEEKAKLYAAMPLVEDKDQKVETVLRVHVWETERSGSEPLLQDVKLGHLETTDKKLVYLSLDKKRLSMSPRTRVLVLLFYFGSFVAVVTLFSLAHSWIFVEFKYRYQCDDFILKSEIRAHNISYLSTGGDVQICQYHDATISPTFHRGVNYACIILMSFCATYFPARLHTTVKTKHVKYVRTVAKGFSLVMPVWVYVLYPLAEGKIVGTSSNEPVPFLVQFSDSSGENEYYEVTMNWWFGLTIYVAANWLFSLVTYHVSCASTSKYHYYGDLLFTTLRSMQCHYDRFFISVWKFRFDCNEALGSCFILLFFFFFN